MLNIRDPLVVLHAQSNGTTSSDPDDLIVTSIIMRHPTDWTANETVATYQDPDLQLSVDKTDEFERDCMS